MKKYQLSFFFTALLFLPSFVFAKKPVTDVNSIGKSVRKIETLPDGQLINLTFKSRIDDSYQPMLAKIPRGYTKAKNWPLLVVLHGLGDGPIVAPSIDSMVQIGPFGRGDMWYQGIGEQDVFECIEFAKQIFNIDSDRIYLCGFSMGGVGTFDLGLKHPDIWAACVPVCGSISNPEMVTNGMNLPFWINTGSEDKVVPAKDSKKTYEKAVELGFKNWKYTEYKGMGHSFRIDWGQIEKWLLSQRKLNNPANISFRCEKPSRAYWTEITEKLSRNKPAKIDITTASQTIKVNISNIADYTLHLKDSPVKISEEITIIENKKMIFKGFLTAKGSFNRKLNSKKTDKACVK